MATVIPAPLCACTKDDLLRDYPGSRVGDPCPLCTVAIGFHGVPTALSPSTVTLTVDNTPRREPQPRDAQQDSENEDDEDDNDAGAAAAGSEASGVGAGAGIPRTAAASPSQGSRSSTELVFGNGCRYSGQVRDGKANGFGTMRWPDGDFYRGEMRDNLKHGYGESTSLGVRYEGEWCDGKRHGRGCETNASGDIIRQGVWNDGQFLQASSELRAATHALPPALAPTAEPGVQQAFAIHQSTASPCPDSPMGHAYRRKWTCCSCLWCLFGCLLCALAQRKRVCKHCGHRSD